MPSAPLRHRRRQAQSRRGLAPDGSTGGLASYFREIRAARVLTRAEEVVLAEEFLAHKEALHSELLSVPLSAHLVVRRWTDLRRAKRVTAALSAVPADRRRPDASARMDRRMGRVSTLLKRRATLEDTLGSGARAAFARIDTQLQRLLLSAELAPDLLEDVLAQLRQVSASLPRRRGPKRARLEREIGLSARDFRSRMRAIESQALGLQQARNRFVEHNLKLVVTIAKEFQGLGLSLSDLIQEGRLFRVWCGPE